MKSPKLLSLSLMLLFTASTFAQIKLNVSGDAEIQGRLNVSSGGNNMFIGEDAGLANTAGSFNTFIGQLAGTANIWGESNTFLGLFAGFSNKSGSENTFLGTGAGLANLSNQNTFVGMNAGRSNTSGNSNTFVGNSAGYFNTGGRDNTFLGMEAGKNNQSSRNTFVGTRAGSEVSNPQWDCNTYIGFETGQYNGGIHNIIVGTCFSIDVGALNSDNTIMGWGAGSLTTSGSANVILGSQAGGNTKSGSDNVFVGRVAGFNNTTGNNNTFVGRNAGFNNVTGDDLVAIGASANASLIANGSINNAFTLGNHSLITASHSGVLGNISLQKIGGYVNWGTASDGRMKTAVQEDIKGLDFILQLRPVSYQVDALKLDRFLKKGMDTVSRSKDRSEAEKATDIRQRKTYEGYLREKSKIRYTGFIAQEVERAAAEADFVFSGVVKPSHDQDHYSLRYAEFVVPLVKAVQEQQQIIEEQKEAIKALNKKNKETEQLKQEVAALKSLVEKLLADDQEKDTEGSSYVLPLEQKAMLAQNRPNPFGQNTIIDYYIPEDVKDAHIRVTAADGKELGVVHILETGSGQVTIRANAFPAGTYYYSLVFDGQVFETKRMVLTH